MEHAKRQALRKPAAKTAENVTKPARGLARFLSATALPPGDFVYAKDVALASGLSHATILRRIALAGREPQNPRGLPAHAPFGKPYRIRRAIAAAWIGGVA